MLVKGKAWLAIGIETNLDGAVADVYAPAPSTEVIAIDPREMALSERLRAGEMEAFAELVAEFQPLVYSVTLRIVRDAEEARDVTQETFLRIYRHFDRFRGESSLKTWVCRIAVNQALNSQRWWKRRRRAETHSLDDPLSQESEDRLSLGATLASTADSPETEAITHERQQQLERALGELKNDFRIAVALRDIEGMSYEEIANILEISVGTVKSRIARGREMLRTRLSKTINCL
ncbi:MAG: sigma-70 family RNA polymerase sigma factor [Blastocatellia bacterium]|nr:sigma-70 family RNA polymerase sigma factor [Blastocatellia bacterium]